MDHTPRKKTGIGGELTVSVYNRWALENELRKGDRAFVNAGVFAKIREDLRKFLKSSGDAALLADIVKAIDLDVSTPQQKYNYVKNAADHSKGEFEVMKIQDRVVIVKK